ncbi:MAG: hypothetical protein J5828_02440, partial [Desulfovibrionaceae bacterium]|nr:hypothetical protein [Desulfovibrionaceae bacterium]
GGKEGTAARIMSEKERQDACFITGTYLVCVSSDKAAGDPDLDSRLPRMLAVRARNTMFRHLIFKTDRIQFRHKEIYYDICAGHSQDGSRYLPSGIESSSSAAGGFIYSAISVPYEKSLDEFSGRARTYGREDYCAALLAHARSLEGKGRHADAIACLDELLSMKKDSRQGHVLLSKCLMEAKQDEMALKQAKKALAGFRDSLSSEECETLGDVFLELGAKDDATDCYRLAAERFRG